MEEIPISKKVEWEMIEDCDLLHSLALAKKQQHLREVLYWYLVMGNACPLISSKS